MADKREELVVLVCSTVDAKPVNVPVSLILSEGAAEVHSTNLELARQDLESEGYTRRPDQDISLLNRVPERIRPKGAARLEVWGREIPEG